VGIVSCEVPEHALLVLATNNWVSQESPVQAIPELYRHKPPLPERGDVETKFYCEQALVQSFYIPLVKLQAFGF
jgi:hypothetical protein